MQGNYVFIPIKRDVMEQMSGESDEYNMFFIYLLDHLKQYVNVNQDDTIYLDDIDKVFGAAISWEELVKMDDSGIVVVWEIDSGQPIEHIWRGKFSNFPRFEQLEHNVEWTHYESSDGSNKTVTFFYPLKEEGYSWDVNRLPCVNFEHEHHSSSVSTSGVVYFDQSIATPYYYEHSDEVVGEMTNRKQEFDLSTLTLDQAFNVVKHIPYGTPNKEYPNLVYSAIVKMPNDGLITLS